jgi:hypothetical protein
MVEATVAVTARYPSAAATKEPVKLLGLSEAAKGEDICKAFVNTVSGLDIDESIFVSAPLVVGSNAGFVALLSMLRLSVGYCIGEYSEASQKRVEQWMGTVTKALNCFVSLVFNHLQLKVFCVK